MKLKKSYSVELDADQENFLKVWFSVYTDAELRVKIERVILDLIARHSPYSNDTAKELDDFNLMKQSGIRG